MKLIPNFEEFERSAPLEGKISPSLQEKLSGYFSDQEDLNEAQFGDMFKNFLSKTFLGSLSYINMIDKLRSEILRLEKESVTKKYQHEAEIESLNNSIKNLIKTNNESGVAQAKKNIENKLKEQEVYQKMVDAKVKKSLDLVSDIIQGNKRRTKYWEEGKASDEAELLEFEYNLAKKKFSYSSAELKKLEAEWKKAEEKAKQEKEEREALEKQEKEKKEREAGGGKSGGIVVLDDASSNYDKAIKSSKSRLETINKLKKEIADLETKEQKQKEGVEKVKTKKEIENLKHILSIFEDVHKKLQAKKILTKDQVNKIFRDAIGKMGPNIINLGAGGSSLTSSKRSPSQTLISQRGSTQRAASQKRTASPDKKIPEDLLEETLAMIEGLRAYTKFTDLIDKSGIMTWVGSCYPSYSVPDTSGNVYQDDIKKKFPKSQELAEGVEKSLTKLIKTAKPNSSLDIKGTDKSFADPKCITKIENFLETFRKKI